jgi:hypothetical protein
MSDQGSIDQQTLWQQQAKTQLALLEAIQSQIGRSASASRNFAEAYALLAGTYTGGCGSRD